MVILYRSTGSNLTYNLFNYEIYKKMRSHARVVFNMICIRLPDIISNLKMSEVEITKIQIKDGSLVYVS